jgi:dienelactone hydrolase
MNKFFTSFITLIFSFVVLSATAQKPSTAKGKEVSYSSEGKTMKSYIVYNDTKAGKRPGVIVIPEWWGNNEYTRMRANMLADLGYIAIAVDMYGEGKVAADPKEAGELATPFYKDPQLAQQRIEAAVRKLKEYPQVDSTKIAAIGYCFGGSMALNAAKIGMDFKGVVSFHGGLATVPATEGTTKAAILVCHGGADKFISPEELKTFRDNLDAMKVDYTFKVYEGATHAFTNPAATATGKKFNMPIEYNEAADKQSWQDMKDFFKKIF